MKKRVLSLILVVVLCLSLLPAAAMADSGAAQEITTASITLPAIYVAGTVLPAADEFLTPADAGYSVTDVTYYDGASQSVTQMTAGTAYTAALRLTAKDGYCFGTSLSSFSVNGGSWAAEAGDGSYVTVSYSVTAVAATGTTALNFADSTVQQAYATEQNGVQFTGSGTSGDPYTLHLHNAVITARTSNYGINVPHGTVVSVSGTNYIDAVSETSYTFVLGSDGALSIEGSGSLTLKSCSPLGTYGILASSDLTVSGSVTVNAVAVGSDTYNCGVYSYNDVTVSGGTLNAVSGSAVESAAESCGVSSYGDITVSGGTLNAVSGDASGDDAESYGIYAVDGGVLLDSGRLSAASGDASGYDAESNGIYCYSDLCINDGTLCAVAGSAEGDGSYSCGAYMYWWYFHMNGGTAYVSGGSTGIYAGNGALLTGGTLSVEGGEYGIGSGGSITVYGGNSCVTGGEYSLGCDALILDNYNAGLLRTVGAYDVDAMFENGITPTTGTVGTQPCAEYVLRDENVQSYAESCVNSLLNTPAMVSPDETLTISDVSLLKGAPWQLYSFNESDIAAGNAVYGSGSDLAGAIGFSRGLILSGGDAKEPFRGMFRGGDCINLQERPELATVDADLAATIRYQTYDTAALQFSVKVPESAAEGSFLTFNYAFATYEMAENDQYNDAFKLFVKDTTDGGSFTNVAKMAADTSKDVSVASIRELTVAADFDHERSLVQFNDQYKEDGWSGNYYDLDSFPLYQAVTDVYTTKVQVVPGHTYVFKFAVADASDASYGTAVYVEAGSLRLGLEPPTVNGLTAGAVQKNLTKDQLTFSAKQSGTVYMVPAGRNYSSLADLQSACKASRPVTVGAQELSGTTDKVPLKGISKGSYVAYLAVGNRISLPSDPFYITLTAIESAADLTADPSAAESALETNGGDAAWTPGVGGAPNTLVLDDIEVESTADPAVKLPANTTVTSGEYGSAIEAVNGTAIEADGSGTLTIAPEKDFILRASEYGIGATDADVVLSGSGKAVIEAADYGILAGSVSLSSDDLTISALDYGTAIGCFGDVQVGGSATFNGSIGIECDGDVEISGDLTVNASAVGIGCGTLTVKPGAVLTVNMLYGNSSALYTDKLVIPEGYEIIGGSVDKDGVFTPDTSASQLIIRPRTVYYDETLYAVTAEAEAAHGSLSVNVKTAPAGQTVTVTLAPEKGFTLETLSVADASGKTYEVRRIDRNKYSFRMPAAAVTVSATFMEDNSMLNFCVDVKAKDYGYDAVYWAYEHKITKGIDALHFGPDQDVTRAQIITLLWRAAGEPASSGGISKFTDVTAGSYYEQALAWAIEKKIAKGVSETVFAPDAYCTRAQAVTFLARYAGITESEAESRFEDVKSTDFAAAAVQWAVDNGVTYGTTETTFSPNAYCTRVQIVTFLYRWTVR